MARPHEMYIDRLAFQLGGYPLWDPTHPDTEPVDIGDVGYVTKDGGWAKLFNLRTDTDTSKLPPNHQLGSVILDNEDVSSGVFKGPRYSKSVCEVAASGDIGISTSHSFQCREEKGAILFVADDAVSRNALAKRRFAKLIQEHIQNWVEFAEQQGKDVQMKDLILVTGYVRTTTWAATVFKKKLQGALPGVVGEVKEESWSAWTGGPKNRVMAGSHYTANLLEGTAQRVSPVGLLPNSDPRHQCVLLRGYRMVKRTAWRRLSSRRTLDDIGVLCHSGVRGGSSAAGHESGSIISGEPFSETYTYQQTKKPSHSISNNESLEEKSESECSSSDAEDCTPLGALHVASEFLTPWDVLLEYILQSQEKADFAIVHDRDFSVIGVKANSADELRRQLKISKPKVYMNGSVGMLRGTAKAVLPHDSTDIETEE